jgi:hypothetical protein
MTSTVADVMLERLRDWGVDHVFGYAGDGINGLLSAWDATWEQVEKALESIVRGDSDRVDIIKEGVKSKVQEFLPGRGGHS